MYIGEGRLPVVSLASTGAPLRQEWRVCRKRAEGREGGSVGCRVHHQGLSYTKESVRYLTGTPYQGMIPLYNSVCYKQVVRLRRSIETVLAERLYRQVRSYRTAPDGAAFLLCAICYKAGAPDGAQSLLWQRGLQVGKPPLCTCRS